MSKLRSVSTAVWSDVWFEDLTASQKLIWLYLITNEKTNMLGIYEASTKKIAFETGVNKSEVEKALKQFETDGRVQYKNNHVILTKFLKHQNFNTNMKKSAIDVFNNLPKELKGNDLTLDKANPLESFETLSKHLGILSKVEVEYEVEVESEYEVKDETEKERRVSELFNRFWILYDKKTNKEKCFKKFRTLKAEEMEQIFIHLPDYVSSTPDKKFRKDPTTYLNNKSFNDEIIISNGQNGKQEQSFTEKFFKGSTDVY